MNIVYLNGKYLPLKKAKISVLDRGFLFADGVYENIPAYFGKPFLLKKHIQRLHKNLQEIHLDIFPPDWDKIFHHLLIHNKIANEHVKIYVQITRGMQPARQHQFSESKIKPTIFVILSKLSLHETPPACKVITTKDIRWAYSHIKTIALLPNILLYEQAKKQNAEDALLIRNNKVIEGTTSNVFMVKDSILITPPESQYMLSGITRECILELAQHEHLPYQIRDIELQELKIANEIWISSSSRDIMPVIQINDDIIADGKPGKYWKQMLKLLRDYRKNM